MVRRRRSAGQRRGDAPVRRIGPAAVSRQLPENDPPISAACWYTYPRAALPEVPVYRTLVSYMADYFPVANRYEDLSRKLSWLAAPDPKAAYQLYQNATTPALGL